MKNILLISANQFDKPYPVYPLGLSYLKSYAEGKLISYSVDIFDCYTSNLSELTTLLQKNKPRYVGISLRNIDDVNSLNKESFIEKYKEIVTCIKSNSSAIIIIGGAGFSIFPKKLFDLFKPNFGIKGEGEESLVELISRLDQHEDYTHIEGLVYTKESTTVINDRSHYCREIDLKFNNDSVDYYWKNSGMLNIQSKRGCPYRCIYCSYPVIEGRKVRKLEASRIVSTLIDLYKQKGIDYVFFTDSVFNIENVFNQELAERIIASEIKIKWGAYFSIKNLDEKLVQLLKKSGLTHIEFGTESLSNQTLNHYKKPFTVADIIEKSNMCEKLDVDFVHFLILGGYGETEDSLNETFENSKLIGRTAFFPFIGMRIYPGTELQKIAINEGKINREDDLLSPKYYISDKVNISNLVDLKKRAAATGKNWIFPDTNLTDIMQKLRQKNKKGPLWEYSLK